MKSIANSEINTITRSECFRIIESLEDTISQHEQTINEYEYKIEAAITKAIRQTTILKEAEFLYLLKELIQEFCPMTDSQKKLLTNLRYTREEILSWLHSAISWQKAKAETYIRYSSKPSQQELFKTEDTHIKRNYTTKGEVTKYNRYTF